MDISGAIKANKKPIYQTSVKIKHKYRLSQPCFTEHLLVLAMKNSGLNQTVKEEPQPQVVLAFGLLITNRAPCRPSV